MKEMMDALHHIVGKLDKIHGVVSQKKYGKKKEEDKNPLESPEEEMHDESLEDPQEEATETPAQEALEEGQEPDEMDQHEPMGLEPRNHLKPGSSNPLQPSGKSAKMIAMELLLKKHKK